MYPPPNPPTNNRAAASPRVMRDGPVGRCDAAANALASSGSSGGRGAVALGSGRDAAVVLSLSAVGSGGGLDSGVADGWDMVPPGLVADWRRSGAARRPDG